MPIKETIKIMLAKSDVTLTEVINRLNNKHKSEFVPTIDKPEFKPDTVQNLSKKINKGTLRYEEAEEIAELLGYKIEWIKK
jgi:hypothetical protein